MVLRQKTKESKAFMSLLDIYQNREKKALEWSNQGHQVVAELGCDVPDEILMAGGYLPVRVYGGKDLDVSKANIYLENAYDPMTRAYFERIVDGFYGRFARHLVISKSTDSLIKAFYYLREIRKLEPEVPVPPLYFIEWFFINKNMLSQQKNWDRVESFRKAVEVWAGRDIKDDEIWKACEICNEDRAAMREFSARRYELNGNVTGSEALVAIGASMFMDRKEHAELMKQLNEDAKTWDEVPGKRVFVTGSEEEDTELYDLIEECGGFVVSEDHNWGDRHIDRDVDLTFATPERALVDRFTNRTPSPKRSLIAPRVESICRDVKKSNAQCVIIYVHKFEESPSWDYPSQIAALKELNIPVLVLAKQEYKLSDNVELKDKISNFLKEVQ